MKLKICLIIPQFVAGGAEQVVLALAKEYRALGHEVSIMSMGSGGNMAPVFKKSGIELVELGIQRHFRMSPFWLVDVASGRKKIAQCLAEKRFDVVHTHLMGTDIDCLYAAKKVGVKAIVHTIQNIYDQYQSKSGKDRVRNWRRKRAYAKHDHVYAVDDEVRAWTIKCEMVGPEHITTISNGVDFSRLNISLTKEELRGRYGFNEGQVIALNVGSLTKQKNHVTLIKAMRTVAKTQPNIHLLIAGDGPLKDALQKEIAEAGLGDVVELLGYRDDIPSLMKASDLFIFPSLWEGLPIALLEAMATGIPVVASDLPVHRRILKEGLLGTLCSITPDGVAAAMSTVIDNKSISLSKALSAREEAYQCYDSSMMAEAYLRHYKELLARKTGE